MTIYDLKPAFQNLLRPIVRFLNKTGVTPNQVTLMTCLLSIFYSVAIYKELHHLFIMFLPLFFFIRMALNAIDGMLAKEHDMMTPRGAMLNEITDVVSDTFLYLSLSVFSVIDNQNIVFFSFIAIFTEVSGLSSLHIGSARRFDGPFGKSDRAFFISVLALLITFTSIEKQIYDYLFYVSFVLLGMTVVNRMNKAIKALKDVQTR
ncbi:MAG: CDP-alcohol phosphatidyltransferase family protein [Bdellovibrionota bacterium]|nr:CDP-alcohol phosphatidyltransferase family protein [Bdellovibrionota bacterium]